MHLKQLTHWTWKKTTLNYLEVINTVINRTSSTCWYNKKKDGGRWQSHFRTFSAFQSNKAIPKVHRWKGVTHTVSLTFAVKVHPIFRDVHKNHLLLPKYYNFSQILDPNNTRFACIDTHQFSKSVSFYLPQSACSIHYGQYQRECKPIHYFYCLFFSYCVIAVKKILQTLLLLEISRNSILTPCLIAFCTFCSHHHFQ